MATEDFDNAAELCAAILERGVASQIKRGLGREYVGRTEALSSLRGKIEITESVKSQTFHRRQMVCTFDESTVGSHMNRIIKATVAALVRSDISKGRKKSLKKLTVYFTDVQEINLRLVDWNLRYDRSNRTIHSGNLYQIFTYVKNKEAGLAGTGAPHKVSGVLLYARTDEDAQPDGVYQISVKTFDLNQPVDAIRAQLDAIAEAYFEKVTVAV